MIRYWQRLNSILAGARIRYWQGSGMGFDTGRRARFDTGREAARAPILADIPIRYWLPILAGIAVFACSSPGWVVSSTQAPEAPQKTQEATESPIPAPEKAPARRELSSSLRGTVSALRAVNVRQEASRTSRSLGVLYHGKEIEISGRCSGIWVEVEFEGRLAWVNGLYLSGHSCTNEEGR